VLGAAAATAELRSLTTKLARTPSRRRIIAFFTTVDFIAALVPRCRLSAKWYI
jgi:hypothetical protein